MIHVRAGDSMSASGVVQHIGGWHITTSKT